MPPQEEITIWEGEWTALKRVVSCVRGATSGVAFVLTDMFDLHMYRDMAKGTLSRADGFTVTQTKAAGTALRQNPWLVPAGGIAASSMFVFAKSQRWGLWAATRNSAIAATVLIVGVFPHEIRRVAVGAFPPADVPPQA